MRVTVTKDHDPCHREVWQLKLLAEWMTNETVGVRLLTYSQEVRASKRHKWVKQTHFGGHPNDSTDGRHPPRMRPGCCPLPDDVLAEATAMFIKEVQTAVYVLKSIHQTARERAAP